MGALPFSVTVGDFNADGRPDIATVNISANSVSILLNTSPTMLTVVNGHITFVPLSGTFRTALDRRGCPPAFVGKFSFNARLTSQSTSSALTNLVTKVNTLTNGNLVQNADWGPGGIGATVSVPRAGGMTDGVLSPREFVDVPFIICLRRKALFQFVVDVLGVEHD